MAAFSSSQDKKLVDDKNQIQGTGTGKNWWDVVVSAGGRFVDGFKAIFEEEQAIPLIGQELSKQALAASLGDRVIVEGKARYLGTAPNEDWMPIMPYMVLEPDEYNVYQLACRAGNGEKLLLRLLVEDKLLQDGFVQVEGTLDKNDHDRYLLFVDDPVCVKAGCTNPETSNIAPKEI